MKYERVCWLAHICCGSGVTGIEGRSSAAVAQNSAI